MLWSMGVLVSVHIGAGVLPATLTLQIRYIFCRSFCSKIELGGPDNVPATWL